MEAKVNELSESQEENLKLESEVEIVKGKIAWVKNETERIDKELHDRGKDNKDLEEKILRVLKQQISYFEFCEEDCGNVLDELNEAIVKTSRALDVASGAKYQVHNTFHGLMCTQCSQPISRSCIYCNIKHGG